MASNKEGEDLAVPLPKEWNLAALQKMPVTLYGAKISPPCCKLRFLLKYYKVPFTSLDGKKPGSEYTKIPVLDIGDRQINDSYIIVKNLAPILQGRPLTPEEVELEKTVTFGLMIELERVTGSSTCALFSCAGLMGGGMGCCLRIAAPCIACCIGPNIGKDKGLKSLGEYQEMLVKHLKGDFFGGSDPGVLDASIYGVLMPFDAAHVPAVESLLGDLGAPLQAWHQRMTAKAAGIEIF